MVVYRMPVLFRSSWRALRRRPESCVSTHVYVAFLSLLILRRTCLASWSIRPVRLRVLSKRVQHVHRLRKRKYWSVCVRDGRAKAAPPSLSLLCVEGLLSSQGVSLLRPYTIVSIKKKEKKKPSSAHFSHGEADELWKVHKSALTRAQSGCSQTFITLIK